jgi:hypothetical protein
MTGDIHDKAIETAMNVLQHMAKASLRLLTTLVTPPELAIAIYYKPSTKKPSLRI